MGLQRYPVGRLGQFGNKRGYTTTRVTKMSFTATHYGNGYTTFATIHASPRELASRSECPADEGGLSRNADMRTVGLLRPDADRQLRVYSDPLGPTWKQLSSPQPHQAGHASGKEGEEPRFRNYRQVAEKTMRFPHNR